MKISLWILLFIVCYVFGNIGITILGLSNTTMLYFLSGYAMVMIISTKPYRDNTMKWALWIVAGGLIMLCVRAATGILDESVQSTVILILPALLISLFPMQYESEGTETRIMAHRFIYWFYIMECSMAIIEFCMEQHIFGWIEQSYMGGIVNFHNRQFRSVALCGGPLLNAQIVTTIMLFILFDICLPLREKIPLWLLGLVAVFCFNARMAIIINLSGILFYAGKEICRKPFQTKIKYIILLFFIGISVPALFMMNLGNRLTATSSFVNDDSISIRLVLIKYFLHSDFQAYIWGHSMDALRHIMNIIGVKVIENFWIIYIYHFGIVFTAYFSFCYYKLGRLLLKPYPMFDKIIISVLFVILISSNNSVASSYMPLFIFLLCCYTNQLKWNFVNNLQIHLNK